MKTRVSTPVSRPARIFLLAAGISILVAGASLATPSQEWADFHDGGLAWEDENQAVLVDAAGNPIVGGKSYDGILGADLLFRKLDRLTHEEIWSTRFPSFDDSDMELSEMVWDGYGNILAGSYISGCPG